VLLDVAVVAAIRVLAVHDFVITTDGQLLLDPGLYANVMWLTRMPFAAPQIRSTGRIGGGGGVGGAGGALASEACGSLNDGSSAANTDSLLLIFVFFTHEVHSWFGRSAEVPPAKYVTLKLFEER
jgi:hypothetical protein